MVHDTLCRSFRSRSKLPSCEVPRWSKLTSYIRNACCVNIQIDRCQQQIIHPDKLLCTDARHLQGLIHSISITSKTQPLVPANRLVDLLSDPTLTPQGRAASDIGTDDVSDYAWLVAAKAAVQASGLVMHTLIGQTLELHDEISYWNEVLGSTWYSSLYAAQTFPVRLWHWSTDIHSVQGVHARQTTRFDSVNARWARFYQIARSSVRGLLEHPITPNLASPVRSSRSEARQKRDILLAMKDVHSSSLGLLMQRWNTFQAENFASSDPNSSLRRCQDMVYGTVPMIEGILKMSTDSPNTTQFEQNVLAIIDKDVKSAQALNGSSYAQSSREIRRLVYLLQTQLPRHIAAMSTFKRVHGRPSKLTRYWLPVLTALLSSSASLRFLLHRQDEIIQWIAGIGSTVIDFGTNWVVDPIRKLIGTIRHDEKSEIAIMSKNSLVADRASLERMVMDFVRDRPDSGGANLSGEDATAIASAVKEGDLTPVLKAYERDLRSPFVGTVRGDLVRALLIQIQKTKVDVEIAISGIDALLKSQELVFG